jgi:hypothetical protein
MSIHTKIARVAVQLAREDEARYMTIGEVADAAVAVAKAKTSRAARRALKSFPMQVVALQHDGVAAGIRFARRKR